MAVKAIPNNLRMQECWIDLIDNVAFSPSGNGTFINLTQVNDPIWKGTFLTPPLERPMQAVWSAWRKSLRGGFNTFTAFDVRRRRPLAYPNANVPGDIQGGWSGLASVTALAGPLLSLGGLPTNYQVKAGDRFGLEQNGKIGYYEAVEDVSGSSVVVTVAPFLHTGYFTTSAVCRVWQAKCQFIMDQTSWRESGTVEITPVSFNGLQRL